MIRKIKFASIPVADQDRALDFYLNTLGFSLVTDQPMGPGMRWVEVRPPKGETGLALFTAPGHEDRVGTFTGLSWECDDLEKTHRELTAKGVEFAKAGVVPAIAARVGRTDAPANPTQFACFDPESSEIRSLGHWSAEMSLDAWRQHWLDALRTRCPALQG